MNAKSISCFDLKELENLMENLGEKPYRARQILLWLYTRYAMSFDQMTDLPESLRDRLSLVFRISSLDLISKKEAPGAWSKKYLWGRDGQPLVESVLLRYKYGLTGCVSTQVGCPIGCAFCASGLIKHERNLEPQEIVDQVLGMAREEKERVGHVVFMGTGEPFLNYTGVIKAIDSLCDPKRYGLSRRKVTVSTVGIPDKIRLYANDCRGSRLAISLHAASDDKRDQLIPLNRTFPIGQLMAAAREFSQKTGQRITFEYLLLNGFNDQKNDALRLSSLLDGLDCLVNLIPWNEVADFPWNKPSEKTIDLFRSKLERNRVKVTVRRSLGETIEAACGQLKRGLDPRYS
jgi:23S rRNA (adenine2503-C2)-methyltransferase